MVVNSHFCTIDNQQAGRGTEPKRGQEEVEDRSRRGRGEGGDGKSQGSVSEVASYTTLLKFRGRAGGLLHYPSSVSLHQFSAQAVHCTRPHEHASVGLGCWVALAGHRAARHSRHAANQSTPCAERSQHRETGQKSREREQRAEQPAGNQKRRASAATYSPTPHPQHLCLRPSGEP